MGLNETRTAPSVPRACENSGKVQPRDIIQRHRYGVYNDMIKNNLFIKMGGHAASLNTCYLPI